MDETCQVPISSEEDAEKTVIRFVRHVRQDFEFILAVASILGERHFLGTKGYTSTRSICHYNKWETLWLDVHITFFQGHSVPVQVVKCFGKREFVLYYTSDKEATRWNNYWLKTCISREFLPPVLQPHEKALMIGYEYETIQLCSVTSSQKDWGLVEVEPKCVNACKASGFKGSPVLLQRHMKNISGYYLVGMNRNFDSESLDCEKKGILLYMLQRKDVVLISKLMQDSVKKSSIGDYDEKQTLVIVFLSGILLAAACGGLYVLLCIIVLQVILKYRQKKEEERLLEEKRGRKTVGRSTNTLVNTTTSAMLGEAHELMDLTTVYPEIPASRKPVRFPWVETSSISLASPLPLTTTKHKQFERREHHDAKYPKELYTTRSMLEYFSVGLPAPVNLGKVWQEGRRKTNTTAELRRKLSRTTNIWKMRPLTSGKNKQSSKANSDVPDSDPSSSPAPSLSSAKSKLWKSKMRR
ncbi:unnamed protein product [Cyprideis torosa]|uniref:Uncharacterized protein n=1 Tax=Cyprideis torosa TaxID=163714 RepID=A0A7R8ZVZ8_9CRUS|nr:unnamed protein product [Cyprideis torosa]CAG0903826.1 unnamed protein product [Cyprideis torosa]